MIVGAAPGVCCPTLPGRRARRARRGWWGAHEHEWRLEGKGERQHLALECSTHLAKTSRPAAAADDVKVSPAELSLIPMGKQHRGYFVLLRHTPSALSAHGRGEPRRLRNKSRCGRALGCEAAEARPQPSVVAPPLRTADEKPPDWRREGFPFPAM